MGGGDGGGAMHRNNNNSSKSPSDSMLVAFHNLDILTLSSSLNWNKVWGDNQHSFCKLTNFVVDNCGELKYLFLPSFGWKLVRLSKLEEIILNDMENLKTIWHHQFDSLKTLKVNKCDKITMLDKNEFLSCVGEEEGIGSVGEDEGRNIILIILVPRLRGRPIQQLRWHV
ncbi:hypothetical protein MTR_4g024950 [Medicago truncatula]|uniref:Uncharacterized protein n=1 Tax=Medicago truncatula TaxID=3880 RepID=G7JFU4_MEDTR|nr:hypothetical protein MTR_4g024950 [Medicago truncatula]